MLKSTSQSQVLMNLRKPYPEEYSGVVTMLASLLASKKMLKILDILKTQLSVFTK